MIKESDFCTEIMSPHKTVACARKTQRSRSLKMHSFSMTSCNFYIEEGKEYEAKSRKIVVGVSFILLF